MQIYSIYKITNTVNDKVYIGKTSKTAEQRFRCHVWSHTRSEWKHLKIYRAMTKYGIENFSVETIYQTKDKQHHNEIEQHFIDFFNSIDCGYNTARGGQGGDIRSKEQKEQLSKIMSGEKNPIYKIINNDQLFQEFKRKVSIGTKAGISKSDKAKKAIEKNKERLLNNNPNTSSDPETIKKRVQSTKESGKQKITITPCIIIHCGLEYKFMTIIAAKKFCKEQGIPDWSLFRKGSTPDGKTSIVRMDPIRTTEAEFKTLRADHQLEIPLIL